MFVVLLTYKVPLDVLDQSLLEHRAFLETQYQQNRLICSGPQNPRTGGVILANCKDRQELEALIAQDPFKLKNLADYEIIEFTPVKYAASMSPFIR